MANKKTSKKRSVKRGSHRKIFRGHLVSGTNATYGFGRRVMMMSTMGMSMQDIAKELCTGREVISKIIRSPEMQEELRATADALQRKIFKMAPKIFRSLVWAVDTEEDGRMAYQLALGMGAIQPAPKYLAMHVQPGQQTIDVVPEDVEQAAAKDWATKLGLMAIEKNKVYGTTLPELEEETESTRKKRVPVEEEDD